MTGNRANGLIIDDPVKGRDEAGLRPDPERARAKAYEDDLKTRLVPGGWIILIQTRWHEDDLAGSILPKAGRANPGSIRCRDGAHWDVLCLPARADRLDDPLGRKIGDYLWPRVVRPRALGAVRAHPAHLVGALSAKTRARDRRCVRSGWLKTYERGPNFTAWRETLSGLRRLGLCGDATGGGDYTVHIVVGIDPAGRIYVLDLWRGQTAANVWVEVLCDLVIRWKPIAWARGGRPDPLRRRSVPDRAPARAFRPTWRAGSFRRAATRQCGRRRSAAAWRSTGLYLPAGAPWVPALRAELLTFPRGRYDDQVDALGLIGQLLDVMRKGKTPAKRTFPKSAA